MPSPESGNESSIGRPSLDSRLEHPNPPGLLKWRPTSYRERLDVELGAVEPFLVDIPFESIDDARRMESEQSAAWMKANAIYLEAATVEHFDATVSRADGSRIPIRVYRPKDVKPLSGVVMFLHGGGFAIGSIDSEHGRCVYLAKDAECVVVSVEYRLAPEHPFPAAFDDCFDVLTWISKNSIQLGVESSNIAIAGSSAGGNLAAAVALKARDLGGPSISLQVLIYPVLDSRMKTASMAEFDSTPVWDGVRNEIMWSTYLSDAANVSAYCSPALAEDFSGLPPALILIAELDPLRDEAIAYAVSLLGAHVPVEMHLYQGAYHGFDLAAPFATISQRAFADQGRAIHKALTHYDGRN